MRYFHLSELFLSLQNYTAIQAGNRSHNSYIHVRILCTCVWLWKPYQFKFRPQIMSTETILVYPWFSPRLAHLQSPAYKISHTTYTSVWVGASIMKLIQFFFHAWQEKIAFLVDERWKFDLMFINLMRVK